MTVCVGLYFEEHPSDNINSQRVSKEDQDYYYTCSLKRIKSVIVLILYSYTNLITTKALRFQDSLLT